MGTAHRSPLTAHARLTQSKAQLEAAPRSHRARVVLASCWHARLLLGGRRAANLRRGGRGRGAGGLHTLVVAQPQQLVRHVCAQATDAPLASSEVAALLHVRCPLREAITAQHRAALAHLVHS